MIRALMIAAALLLAAGAQPHGTDWGTASAQPDDTRIDEGAGEQGGEGAGGGSLIECQRAARDAYLSSAREAGMAVEGAGDDASVTATTSAQQAMLRDLFVRQLSEMEACEQRHGG